MHAHAHKVKYRSFFKHPHRFELIVKIDGKIGRFQRDLLLDTAKDEIISNSVILKRTLGAIRLNMWCECVCVCV
jgi:hypothetical protein